MSTTPHRSDKVAQARGLREGGWSTHKIAGFMGVAQSTVMRWTDDEHLERVTNIRRSLDRQRLAAASAGRLRRSNATPEFRQARMVSLRGLGLSHLAIARVMTFDFPEQPISEDQVASALGDKKRGRLSA